MSIWLMADVDVEFDALRFNRLEAGTNNPGLMKGLPLLLEFFHEHGIRATLHMQEQADPELSIIERYPKLYDMIGDYSQDISLHVHVKEESYEKRKKEIESGYNRLKERGYKVESFRAGWYFTNEATIRILEELGVKYDCSPYKNLTVGSKSWTGIPDSPYHPDYRDVTKVGNAKVLIIPINDIRLGIGIHKDEVYESDLMRRGVSTLISKADEIKEPVIIYFTTHSWKPVDEKGNLREWERRRREEFMEFLGQYRFRSLSVTEAGRLWEKNNYSPYFLDLPDLVGVYYSLYNPRKSFWFFKNVVSKLHVLRYRAIGKL